MAYYSAQAGNLALTIGGLPAAYYKKEGLDQVLKKFMFGEACEPDNLPLRSGHTIQWFRYGVLAANTTARTITGGVGVATEGQIGAGTTFSKTTLTAQVSQYADHITVSDFARDIHLDDVLTHAARNLGYRAGLSVDTIVRNEIDTANGTAAELSTVGANFQSRDAALARASLQSADVELMSTGLGAGYYFGLLHPFVEYDLVNDPSAGGVFELYKRSEPESLKKRDDRNFVATIMGVKFYSSTNVFIDTGASPDTYRVYVFGKGGVGKVDLAGKGPSKVKDPKKQMFNITIIPGKAQIADPEGVIGGVASYNFKFVTKILDDSPYRFRIFDAVSSIGA